MADKKKYIGYTEEGYGIISEHTFTKGKYKGVRAREVDFPSPKAPEMDEEEKWWEDNIFNHLPQFNSSIDEILEDEVFQYQNFCPEKCGKGINQATWIRVETESGWNIYSAKPSRKFVDPSQLKRKIKRLSKAIKTEENMSLKDLQETLFAIEKKKEKIEQLTKQFKVAELLEELDLQPKYVSVMRTRTQKMYLLPHQYEVVSNISLYSNTVVQDKSGAVKFKALFTAQDKDIIFYLRQRGIPKEAAIMMAKMKDGYFMVDRNKLVDNIFIPVK
jgi:hypothetical protein